MPFEWTKTSCRALANTCRFNYNHGTRVHEKKTAKKEKKTAGARLPKNFKKRQRTRTKKECSLNTFVRDWTVLCNIFFILILVSAATEASTPEIQPAFSLQAQKLNQFMNWSGQFFGTKEKRENRMRNFQNEKEMREIMINDKIRVSNNKWTNIGAHDQFPIKLRAKGHFE